MTAPPRGSEDPPEVSILVVAYRNVDLTRRCLQSIADHVPDGLYELLVLDNASGDGTAEMIAREFPRARFTASGENLGFARANNVLATTARGRFLLLLNPDTEVHPGAVQALLDCAARHPEGGLYGGRTVSVDGALEPSSCWGAPTLWSLFCFATGLSTAFRRHRLLDPESLGSWPRDTECEVDVVTGCLALIRRTLWNEMGGFDERFWMYGEDLDLSLRLREADYRPMITPAATITHVIGASSPSGAKHSMVLGARLAVIRKHWSRSHALLGTAFTVVGCGLRSLAGGQAPSWRVAWRQRGSWSRSIPPPPPAAGAGGEPSVGAPAPAARADHLAQRAADAPQVLAAGERPRLGLDARIARQPPADPP